MIRQTSNEPTENQQLLRESLRLASQELLPLMRQIRRHMHANPELSMVEVETTGFLEKQLLDLGFTPRSTEKGIGLTFDWECSGASANGSSAAVQRVGLRADIDALPITTSLSTSYASRISGRMHACGHDAHTAVLVGAAAILKQLSERGQLTCPVALRGILQPGEETSEGAAYMLEQGAAKGLRGIYAVHVDPNLQVGQVASRVGPFTAGCDSIEVTVKGRSGHSARPYQAVDALAAATAWVQQAYARVPRVHDCREPSVFSIGTFESGVASNVVADSAKLTGTVRTVSEVTRRQIFDSLNVLSAGIEASHGCQINIEIESHTPSLHNEETITLLAMQEARELLGKSAVGDIPLPSMGAEDFSFLARDVPCCMFRLGTAGPHGASHQAYSSSLHSPDFDIDEGGLVIGAQLLAASVIRLCNDPSSKIE